MLSLSRNLVPETFGELLIMFSASDKTKSVSEIFSENSDLEIFLPAFSSRTTLRLYDTPAIPKLVKEAITDLDLSRTAGLDCISEVVLKNCEPERSYIQKAELFPVLAIKNGEERPTAKNYRPVNVLFVASKIF